MTGLSVKFVGFTEGRPEIGQPIFDVEISHLGVTTRNIVSAQRLQEIGLEVPEPEQFKINDAMHAWNNAGQCDDHLTRFNPHMTLTE